MLYSIKTISYATTDSPEFILDLIEFYSPFTSKLTRRLYINLIHVLSNLKKSKDKTLFMLAKIKRWLTTNSRGARVIICYYDESGDDGFPSYSSPLFVLCGIYFDHLKWKENHENIVALRRELKATLNFPVNVELHTKQFLLDKDPYRNFGFTNADRIGIITRFCAFIGSLDIKIINILINKTIIRKNNYDVMNTSLKYSVQRIENDIDPQNNPDMRFMIITDEGRVGKMRKTTRAIQRINHIPSRFGTAPIRKEIESLIEDPLPKDSKESYFIQMADLVAYLVYLYGMKHTGTGSFPNRLNKYVDENQLRNWLELLKPSFNLKAAPKNEFGIKIHPN